MGMTCLPGMGLSSENLRSDPLVGERKLNIAGSKARGIVSLGFMHRKGEHGITKIWTECFGWSQVTIKVKTAIGLLPVATWNRFRPILDQAIKLIFGSRILPDIYKRIKRDSYF